MTIANTILGVIDSPVRIRGTMSVVAVRPLAIASDDNSKWERVLSTADCIRDFPNRGSISWLNPEIQTQKGTLWQFRVDLQPSFESDRSNHDRYCVARNSAEPVLEVLDVGSFDTEDEVREILTTKGLADVFKDSQYYFCLDKKLWTTVRMKRKSDDPRRRIVDLENDGMLRLVEWRAPCDPATYSLDRDRTIFPPGVRPHGRPHLRDWSSDPDLLVRVLKALRKRDRSFADALKLTEKAVSHLSDVLAAASNISEPEMEMARVQRVVKYVNHLKCDQEILAIATAAIADSPISDQIEALKQQMLTEERSSMKARAEAEVTAERRVLEALRAEITERRNDLSSIENQIKQTRALQEDAVRNLEKGLAERVRIAIEQPAELLGSVALIRAVNEGRQLPLRVHTDSSHNNTTSHQGHINESPSKQSFFDSVRMAMAQHDVPPILFRALHASFLAGAMPVVVGSRAHELLSTYAIWATGRQVCWIPVSPTWLAPSEYLANSANDGHSGVTRPTYLLELLRNAETDNRLHMVVFEGLNRAPIEGYLAPLLACHADSGSSTPRSYPLPYMPIPFRDGTVTWPSNVLLSGTIMPEVEMAPLPNEMWNNSTLIVEDAVEPSAENLVFANQHPDKRFGQRDLSDATFISSQSWKEWRQECLGQDLAPCVSLWTKLAAKKHLPRSVRNLLLRYYAATRSLTDETEALNDAIAYCLLPHFLHANDMEFDALIASGNTAYGDAKLLKAVTSSMLETSRR